MNVTMCTNNHYFDSDMYDVCPICGAGVKANNFSDSGKKSSGSPKFGGLFHKKKNTEERAAEPVSRLNPVSMPESFSQSGKKMPVYSNQVSGTTGGGGLQPIGGHHRFLECEQKQPRGQRARRKYGSKFSAGAFGLCKCFGEG